MRQLLRTLTAPATEPPPSRATAWDRAEQDCDWGAVDAALEGASSVPYWLDDPDRPAAQPALSGEERTDLAVVGGGFAGLWTALRAKERDPHRDVVLLEAGRIGWAATGRNGGFCEASLVHGEANGERHLPRENARLTQLGLANLEAIAETVQRYGIDCGFARPGSLNVAVNQHEVAWLREMASDPADPGLLDAAGAREHIDSPLFLGAYWDRAETALVNPARLAWGLARACREAGVRIYEHTQVTRLRGRGSAVVLECRARDTEPGEATQVRASRVALATNAFPALLRRHRHRTVPVYDHVLVTEPLSPEQEAAIGWEHGEGLADLGNRFHYARPLRDADGRLRILWGGYDAVYHYGSEVKSRYDQHPETFRKLAAHFQAAFPQLSGLRFSHAWGGAIDTCSRFFAFFDTAMNGRVAAAAGFTGLGVGATRFAADVMLDLLGGTPTELTQLEMVRRKPIPFPPEPLAWLGVRLMTRGLIRADRNQGRRGPFLRVMDAIGMGFDS